MEGCDKPARFNKLVYFEKEDLYLVVCGGDPRKNVQSYAGYILGYQSGLMPALEFMGHSEGPIILSDFHQKRQELITCDAIGNVKVWAFIRQEDGNKSKTGNKMANLDQDPSESSNQLRAYHRCTLELVQEDSSQRISTMYLDQSTGGNCFLFIGFDQGMLSIVDLFSLSIVATFGIQLENPDRKDNKGNTNITTIAYDPETQHLLVGFSDGTIDLYVFYYFASGDEMDYKLMFISTFQSHENGAVNSVVYIPDVVGAISCGKDNVIRHWKPPQTGEIGRYQHVHYPPPASHVPPNRHLLKADIKALIPIRVELGISCSKQLLLAITGELITILEVLSPCVPFAETNALVLGLQTVAGPDPPIMFDSQLDRKQLDKHRHHVVSHSQNNVITIYDAVDGQVAFSFAMPNRKEYEAVEKFYRNNGQERPNSRNGRTILPQLKQQQQQDQQEQDVSIPALVTSYSWNPAQSFHAIGWSDGKVDLLDSNAVPRYVLLHAEALAPVQSICVIQTSGPIAQRVREIQATLCAPSGYQPLDPKSTIAIQSGAMEEAAKFRDIGRALGELGIGYDGQDGGAGGDPFVGALVQGGAAKRMRLQNLRARSPHKNGELEQQQKRILNQVVVGASDGSIRAWQLEQQLLCHTVRAHSGSIIAIHCLDPVPMEERQTNQIKSFPDRQCILSAGMDGFVKLWSVGDMKLLGFTNLSCDAEPQQRRFVKNDQPASTSAVSFVHPIPVFGLFVCGYDNGMVQSWELPVLPSSIKTEEEEKAGPNGSRILCSKRVHNKQVTQISSSMTQPEKLLTASMDHTIMVWSLEPEGILVQVQRLTFPSPVETACFTPVCDEIIVSCGTSMSIVSYWEQQLLTTSSLLSHLETENEEFGQLEGLLAATADVDTQDGKDDQQETTQTQQEEIEVGYNGSEEAKEENSQVLIDEASLQRQSLIEEKAMGDEPIEFWDAQGGNVDWNGIATEERHVKRKQLSSSPREAEEEVKEQHQPSSLTPLQSRAEFVGTPGGFSTWDEAEEGVLMPIQVEVLRSAFRNAALPIHDGNGSAEAPMEKLVDIVSSLGWEQLTFSLLKKVATRKGVNISTKTITFSNLLALANAFVTSPEAENLLHAQRTALRNGTAASRPSLASSSSRKRRNKASRKGYSEMCTQKAVVTYNALGERCKVVYRDIGSQDDNKYLIRGYRNIPSRLGSPSPGQSVFKEQNKLFGLPPTYVNLFEQVYGAKVTETLVGVTGKPSNEVATVKTIRHLVRELIVKELAARESPDKDREHENLLESELLEWFQRQFGRGIKFARVVAERILSFLESVRLWSKNNQICQLFARFFNVTNDKRIPLDVNAVKLFIDVQTSIHDDPSTPYLLVPPNKLTLQETLDSFRSVISREKQPKLLTIIERKLIQDQMARINGKKYTLDEILESVIDEDWAMATTIQEYSIWAEKYQNDQESLKEKLQKDSQKQRQEQRGLDRKLLMNTQPRLASAYVGFGDEFNFGQTIVDPDVEDNDFEASSWRQNAAIKNASLDVSVEFLVEPSDDEDEEDTEDVREDNTNAKDSRRRRKSQHGHGPISIPRPSMLDQAKPIDGLEGTNMGLPMTMKPTTNEHMDGEQRRKSSSSGLRNTILRRPSSSIETRSTQEDQDDEFDGQLNQRRESISASGVRPKPMYKHAENEILEHTNGKDHEEIISELRQSSFASLGVGDHVAAGGIVTQMEEDGSFEHGEIVAVYDDGSYEVVDADGKHRLGMLRADLKKVVLKPGDQVEARWNGSKNYLPGVIEAINEDGTYDVVYDDGERETRIGKPKVRKLLLRPGDYVERIVKSANGEITERIVAQVKEVDGKKDQVSVTYLGNDGSEEVVSIQAVRKIAFKPGDLVETFSRDGFSSVVAVIDTINMDGTYNLTYLNDDGEQEKQGDEGNRPRHEHEQNVLLNVKKPNLRRFQYQVGDSVKFLNAQGGFDTGIIAQASHDGSFQVKCTTGQVVSGISKLQLRRAQNPTREEFLTQHKKLSIFNKDGAPITSITNNDSSGIVDRGLTPVEFEDVVRYDHAKTISTEHGRRISAPIRVNQHRKQSSMVLSFDGEHEESGHVNIEETETPPSPSLPQEQETFVVETEIPDVGDNVNIDDITERGSLVESPLRAPDQPMTLDVEEMYPQPQAVEPEVPAFDEVEIDTNKLVFSEANADLGDDGDDILKSMGLFDVTSENIVPMEPPPHDLPKEKLETKRSRRSLFGKKTEDVTEPEKTPNTEVLEERLDENVLDAPLVQVESDHRGSPRGVDDDDQSSSSNSIEDDISSFSESFFEGMSDEEEIPREETPDDRLMEELRKRFPGMDNDILEMLRENVYIPEHHKRDMVVEGNEMRSRSNCFSDPIKFQPLTLMKQTYSIPHWTPDDGTLLGEHLEPPMEEDKRLTTYVEMGNLDFLYEKDDEEEKAPIVAPEIHLSNKRDWETFFSAMETTLLSKEETETFESELDKEEKKLRMLKEMLDKEGLNVNDPAADEISSKYADINGMKRVADYWVKLRRIVKVSAALQFTDKRQAEARAKKQIPVTELQLQKPVEGRIEKDKFVYFALDLHDADTFLTISIESESGVPDVFVSKDVMPSLRRYSWRTSAIGRRRIVLHPNDPNFQPGKYYIGVYSLIPSSFKLVAEEQDMSYSSENLDNIVSLTNKFNTIASCKTGISTQSVASFYHNLERQRQQKEEFGFSMEELRIPGNGAMDSLITNHENLQDDRIEQTIVQVGRNQMNKDQFKPDETNDASISSRPVLAKKEVNEQQQEQQQQQQQQQEHKGEQNLKTTLLSNSDDGVKKLSREEDDLLDEVESVGSLGLDDEALSFGNVKKKWNANGWKKGLAFPKPIQYQLSHERDNEGNHKYRTRSDRIKAGYTFFRDMEKEWPFHQRLQSAMETAGLNFEDENQFSKWFTGFGGELGSPSDRTGATDLNFHQFCDLFSYFENKIIQASKKKMIESSSKVRTIFQHMSVCEESVFESVGGSSPKFVSKVRTSTKLGVGPGLSGLIEGAHQVNPKHALRRIPDLAKLYAKSDQEIELARKRANARAQGNIRQSRRERLLMEKLGDKALQRVSEAGGW